MYKKILLGLLLGYIIAASIPVLFIGIGSIFMTIVNNDSLFEGLGSLLYDMNFWFYQVLPYITCISAYIYIKKYASTKIK